MSAPLLFEPIALREVKLRNRIVVSPMCQYSAKDGQVGDCVFYNAADHREWFHVGQSWAINGILGTGTSKSFRHFYSKPPRENVMRTSVSASVPPGN